MTCAQWLISTGLILDIFGVVLLYRTDYRVASQSGDLVGLRAYSRTRKEFAKEKGIRVSVSLGASSACAGLHITDCWNRACSSRLLDAIMIIKNGYRPAPAEPPEETITNLIRPKTVGDVNPTWRRVRDVASDGRYDGGSRRKRRSGSRSRAWGGALRRARRGGLGGR